MTVAPVTKPTLLVCSVDEKAPLLHPCAKANKALKKAGVDFDKRVYDQGKPFGRGTEGTRPELKELSGQEMLPVLQLPDGSTVAGGGEIIKWAKAHG
ncbi:MAG: hypothetical protein QOG62_255 [Thermoleophilaceae bacterium]|jgi:glutathione S-transferase|nr:hypothetical protein [Thermoleophilaceae bacterium]